MGKLSIGSPLFSLLISLIALDASIIGFLMATDACTYPLVNEVNLDLTLLIGIVGTMLGLSAKAAETIYLTVLSLIYGLMVNVPLENFCRNEIK